MKLKPMNGQVLGLKEGRKSKKSLVQPFLKGAPKKPKKKLDWDTLELTEPKRGSSESAGKNQLGFGQLREACSWTQGTKKDMSHQSPTTQKKKLWKQMMNQEQAFDEEKPGTSGKAGM